MQRGTPNQGTTIKGLDGKVLSVSKGIVQSVFPIGETNAMMIRSDTLFYSYGDIDSCLVKKGEQVMAGQVIGIAKENYIDFVISDEKGHIHKVQGKLNCKCKMVEGLVLMHSVDTTLEDRAISKLNQLREVRAENRLIDSVTHHKHGVSFLTSHPASAGEPYFVFQVGYNGPDRFETRYTFYVYTHNMTVKVLDPVTGTVLPLGEWRKGNIKRNTD